MDKRYQVFVSSTYTDLKEERKEATQAILECDCFPAGMELFPASNETQWNVIKKVINDSDFYLLIIAGRYGSLGINSEGKKISYTEMEFDYAKSKGIPIIALIHENPETIPIRFSETTTTNINRLKKFREKAATGRTVAFWQNKDQLKSKIITSLNKAIRDNHDKVVGWVRANTIIDSHNNSSTSPLDDLYSDDILSVKQKLEVLNKSEEIIDFLESLENRLLIFLCFKDDEFVKKFASLITPAQSPNIISRAIELFPPSIDNATINYLRNAIDIKSIYNLYCRNNSTLNTEVCCSFIILLRALQTRSREYVEYALTLYKSGNLSPNQKNTCVHYLKDCDLHESTSYGEVRSELQEYIHIESNNINKNLSVKDIIALTTLIGDGPEICTIVYDIFQNSNKEEQREIIYTLFEYFGSDYDVYTPKEQRMFIELCSTIYAWNDDRINADLLLYCLFCRTDDIFTREEIFSQLNKYNDDVFYMFFTDLKYGEYLNKAEATYFIDDNERQRIIKTIKDRNHPKEKRLLENLRDLLL